MTPLKIIRKIGRMLRGGAGQKEILLGALLGVLIGFNPTAGLTLFLAILITLLLNANFGFTLLGVALGKVLSVVLAPLSFHTGYFLIHKIGLEGVFTKLSNAPLTALMDLDVYAMIGGLPYALIIGIVFGKIMSALVTKIREQMVKAGDHDKVAKVAGNKFARFLMWLVFGKQKVSTADVLAKQSPLLRKSGLILVGVVLVIGLLFEFLLLDMFLKKGIQYAVSSQTGAEVNIEEAHFSMGSAKLELKGVQVADPEKLTHNLVQIDTLAADVSMGDLLRQTYTIQLLSGSTLKYDVQRETPAKRIVKEEKEPVPEEKAEPEAEGKPLDEYLVQAEKWKRYGRKLHDVLQQRKKEAEAEEAGEKPEPSKERAVADAKKLGYLKARADLVSTRPDWTIQRVEITDVDLGNDMSKQELSGTEWSSHPALNGKATALALTPMDSEEPTLKLVMRFDDPAAPNQITANLKNIDLADAVKTGDQLEIQSGLADVSLDGSFSVDTLDVPFNLEVHDLKTSNETLNNLPQLKLPGALSGSLTSPRLKVEIGDQLKNAVVDAAKQKAKEEAKKAAQKEIDKALESDEAKDLKEKAGGALKGLFNKGE